METVWDLPVGRRVSLRDRSGQAGTDWAARKANRPTEEGRTERTWLLEETEVSLRRFMEMRLEG